MEGVCWKSPWKIGAVTDNDVEQIAGRRDEPVGRLQKSCGLAKDVAEKQVREFANSLDG